MAEFKGLNKVPKGSAGGWTFTTILGKGVIKQKVTSVNDANTEKQKRQRAKIRGLGKYSQQVSGLTEITLKEIARGRRMYHNNVFVSENTGVVDTTDGKLIEAELPKLYLSGGPGEIVKTPTTAAGASLTIRVTWQTSGYLPSTSPDTKVLWAAYNQNQDFIYFGDPDVKLGDGQIDITGIGEAGNDVFIYIVAFDAASKKGSPTQFLGKRAVPA